MAATKKNTKKTVKKVKTVSAKAKKSTVSVKPPRLKKAAPSKKIKAAPKKKNAAPKPAKKITSKVPVKKVTQRAIPVHIQKKVKKVVGKNIVTAPVRPGKKVKGYSKPELNYFRGIIVDKIREANEELISIEDRLMDSTSGEYAEEDSTYSMHMAEQGTDAMEREKAFLFASRERKFISHLEDAMQRIVSGNFGICINCGNLIDKGRLEAVPHARMCVDCKVDSKKGGE